MKKLISKVIPWIVFAIFGTSIGFGGFFHPSHNWDEIPYTYLASNNECSAKSHAAHYQYLAERIPALQNNISKLLESERGESSYRKRTLTDYKYFCSNLPFYTTKKAYIAFIRRLTSFTSDTLTSVRIASAVPALLWYTVLGLIVLFYLPGGALAKAPALLITGSIGRSLARLSTPDALSCLLVTLSAVAILITSKRVQDKPTTPASATFLSIFCSSALAGLSIGVRSNMFIVLIAFVCGIAPYIKRKLLLFFIGLTLISYEIILKSIPNLLSAYPNSYSHLTLLFFHSGGLFGPANPSSEIRQINILDVATNLSIYFPYISNIIKSSLKAAYFGIRELLFYISIVFLSTFSSARTSGRNIYIDFSVPQGLWIVSGFVGLGYITQVILFPLNGDRMIAPYISLIIASACLLGSRPSLKASLSMNLLKPQ